MDPCFHVCLNVAVETEAHQMSVSWLLLWKCCLSFLFLAEVVPPVICSCCGPLRRTGGHLSYCFLRISSIQNTYTPQTAALMRHFCSLGRFFFILVSVNPTTNPSRSISLSVTNNHVQSHFSPKSSQFHFELQQLGLNALSCCCVIGWFHTLIEKPMNTCT